MYLKQLFILISAIILINPNRLIAQDTSQPYDITDIVKIALSKNLTLQKEFLHQENFSEEIKRAKAAFYPNLNVNLGNQISFGRYIDPYTNNFSSSSTYFNHLSLSSYWELYAGGKNHIQLSIQNLKEQEYSLGIKEQELILKEEVTGVYFSINLLVTQIKILDTLIKNTLMEFDILNTQLKSGRVSEVEVLEITQTISAYEADRIQLKEKLQKGLTYLSKLCNFSFTNTEMIKEPKSISSTNLALDSIHISNHPTIQQHIIKQKLKEKNISLMKAKQLPTISLFASIYTGYSQGNNKFDPITGEELPYQFKDQLSDNRYELISLNIDIPIYNNRNTLTNTNNAKIELEKATLDIDINKQNLIQKFTNDTTKIQRSLLLYKKSEEQLKKSKRIYQLTKEKFALGKINSFEFLYRKQQFLSNLNNFHQMHYSYLLNITLCKIHFVPNFLQ